MLITASVGSSGVNRRDDVTLIQFLLNEWRAQNARKRIAQDGLVGPETIGAIRDFQNAVTHIVDGRVDPGGPAIKELARTPAGEGIRSVASILLTYLMTIETELQRASGNLPDLRAVVRQLKVEAQEAGGEPLPISTAGTARRGPLLAFAIGGSGPPVFGLAITIELILIVLAAILLIILALKAMLDDINRRNGKIDPKTQRWMENIADELGKRVMDLNRQTNDIKRRFERCLNKLVQKSPQCLQAIAVYLQLQALVDAKQARVMQLAAKIGLDIHDKKPVDPAELSELQNLVNELKQLLPKLESALDDMLEKCGCLDEPPGPRPSPGPNPLPQ